MVEVHRALQEDVEPGARLWLTDPGVRRGPVLVALSRDRLQRHVHRGVEIAKYLGLRPSRGIDELAVARANVAGLRHPRADVIAEVSGEMQHQVAKAVAVRVRLHPELLVGERRGELVHATPATTVVPSETHGKSGR